MLPTERDDLRTVRVHGEHFDVVHVLQVLPARKADPAVVHGKQRDDVRQVLRAQLAIRITTRERDARQLRHTLRVVVLVMTSPHLRVALIGREHDAIAGREDRVLIVVRAERELGDGKLAVGAAVHAGPIDVVGIVGVGLHREDDLRAVEAHVDARYVRGRVVFDDVGLHGARAQIEYLEPPSRVVAPVVHHLAHAASDIDADRAVSGD